MARVRADEHGRALRLRPAGRRALPLPPLERRARARLRRAALHHAVELRRRLRREDEGDPDHDGRVRARERLLGRGRARAADRRAERARSRHRRDDREVLPDRGRRGQDHLRLLDRAQPPLGRLPDHGAGRRPGRDRERRRQHRLGRRLRQAPRRPALGGRAPGPGLVRPWRYRGDDDRRESRARPDQPATISAAARSRPTWTRSTARSATSPRRLGVDHRRRRARHRPHREQQHDQRAQAGLAEPRLRPARLHARRLRRRRRDARRGARGRARDPRRS